EPDRGREADLRRRPRSDQEREARRGEKEKHEPENRAAGAEAERVEAEAGERRNRENGDRQRLLRIANAVERRQRAQPRSGRARGRDEERENREGAEEEGERAPPRLEESRQGDGERERTDPDGGNPVRRGGARVDEGRDERRQYERAGLPFDRRQCPAPIGVGGGLSERNDHPGQECDAEQHRPRRSEDRLRPRGKTPPLGVDPR